MQPSLTINGTITYRGCCGHTGTHPMKLPRKSLPTCSSVLTSDPLLRQHFCQRRHKDTLIFQNTERKLSFPQEESGKNRKLSRPWHGPYRVMQCNDPDLTVTKQFSLRKEPSKYTNSVFVLALSCQLDSIGMVAPVAVLEESQDGWRSSRKMVPCVGSKLRIDRWRPE